jgi:hypothetical protein
VALHDAMATMAAVLALYFAAKQFLEGINVGAVKG